VNGNELDVAMHKEKMEIQVGKLPQRYEGS